MDALDDLVPFDQRLQFVHQTGKADYEAVKARYQDIITSTFGPTVL